MRRPANTLLDVALVLVLCAFVAWLARADSLRGEYARAGGFLGGVGTGLIIALLVQRQRCRQVEQALRESEAKSQVLCEANVRALRERKQVEVALQKAQADLVHVTRVSMLGQLATSLAHEINQPLAAVLYNAQAAQRFLANEAPGSGRAAVPGK